MAFDMKLELVFVPVSDVDRAKDFYVNKIGFSADHDSTVSEDLRFVQLTPPGSACSIAIGKGLTELVPGSVNNLMMVIDNAKTAHDELAERGVEVTDLDEQPWGTFVSFTDPDGNSWTLQQLPDRS